jgi:hypothetical protein
MRAGWHRSYSRFISTDLASQQYMFLDIITPTAEGQDKVRKAIDDDVHAKPLVGAALGSWIDFSAHRDVLLRGNVTYK